MDKKSRSLVMGKLFLKRKDYKMAEENLSEYVASNPEDTAALKLLAHVYEQIKRFDKAFDIYERCYLAEPDRTSVLLDICRILLMSEVSLEHVDHRKWLNLAIKNFPSNPIVVDFRAFLATTPQSDYSGSQHEVQSSISTSRPSGGYDSSKVLEKLTSIEKKLEALTSLERRMENIENILNRTSTTESIKYVTEAKQVLPTPAKVPEPIHIPVRAPTPSPVKVQLPVSTPVPSPAKVSEPSPVKVPIPAPVRAPPSVLTPTPSPTPSPAPIPFSTLAPALAPSLVPVPTLAPVLAPSLVPAPTSLSTSKPASLWGSGVESPFNFNTNLFAPSAQKIQTSASESSPFSFNTNLFASSIQKLNISSDAPPVTTNLFAESMKKHNIPTEDSGWNAQPKNVLKFEFSKPKDDDNHDENGDEEVAPNEELAIENTCDMTPIEIKTGEEDENLLFEQRCKLYRFKDKEYKERGLGLIKALKHRETGKGRLIMRREVIGLVCLNCWDCSRIERVKDTQVRWMGIDASDGEPEATVFLAKFKTNELTDEFMSHLTALFTDEASSRNTSLSSPKPKSEDMKGNANGGEPEIELVDPQLDQSQVDKARGLKLPDLFYHKLKGQEPCTGCNGCESDDETD